LFGFDLLTFAAMNWWQIWRHLPTRALYLILVALCLPAFWINLDLMPFIGDEGIRSGVALEMDLSGNYMMPTLNGEPYFNKPPLYNWILLGAHALSGSFNEWTARSTTLLFLLLFAATVFWHMRAAFGNHAGVLGAFMLVTSGRILFWDAMLGLIDICFSWLMYLNWMVLYTYGRKSRYWPMFIMSYGLTALGFLLKGLPALVFQAISLPVALYLLGRTRALFQWSHMVGIATGLVLGGAYYLVYARQVSLDTAFSVLLDQSLQRTVTHYSWTDTLIHLFTFPFEQVYHFLPWSLLVFLVAHPAVRRLVAGSAFVRFNAWMLVANLPVYWSAVEVYARYLLMFIPLFNTVFWYVYQQLTNSPSRWTAVLNKVFTAVIALAAIAIAAAPAVPRLHQLPGMWWFWASLTVPALIVCWGGMTDKRRILLWTVGAVLVARIGLNVFVLPFRVQEARYGYSREQAARAAALYPNHTWHLYKSTVMDNTARFYLENALQQIVTRTDSIKPDAVYLVESQVYPEFPGKAVDSILISGHTWIGVHIHNPE